MGRGVAGLYGCSCTPAVSAPSITVTPVLVPRIPSTELVRLQPYPSPFYSLDQSCGFSIVIKCYHEDLEWAVGEGSGAKSL